MTTPAIVPTDTEGMYPWEWVPEWAQFASVDSNGAVYFYQTVPTLDTGAWFANHGECDQLRYPLRLKPAHRSLDWRTTLRRRPQ